MSGDGVVVIVPDDLASGFRLAGVGVVLASSSDGATVSVDRLLADRTEGVIAVYEPYLVAMDPAMQARYERSLTPVIVPLPAGLREPDAAERRARLSEMLSRAVGYHITFGAEEVS